MEKITLTIPEGVTRVIEDIWSDIEKIVIPNSVVNIGEWAFSGCESLTDIVIPNSVMSIGDYAFRDCESLKEITIPDSITSLNSAFCGCYSLKSIYIDKERYSLDLSRAQLPNKCKVYWKGEF